MKGSRLRNESERKRKRVQQVCAVNEFLNTGRAKYGLIARKYSIPERTLRHAVDKAKSRGIDSLLERTPPTELPPHMRPRLNELDLAYIKKSIQFDPYQYLDELSTALVRDRGVNVSTSTLADTLNVHRNLDHTFADIIWSISRVSINSC